MPFRLSVWFALIHRRFKIEIFVPHMMMSVGRDVIQYSETRLSNFGTCNLSEHPPSVPERQLLWEEYTNATKPSMCVSPHDNNSCGSITESG